jgi:hypothetical protein
MQAPLAGRPVGITIRFNYSRHDFQVRLLMTVAAADGFNKKNSS